MDPLRYDRRKYQMTEDRSQMTEKSAAYGRITKSGFVLCRIKIDNRIVV